ncbi:MAG TPA: DedA family protein [Gemmatimonadales bacterium]|nr:DedA family protein [Gemmatimonadales bacterium]
MSFEHLILRYGLAAVFLGAAVEGDLTLILAGVAAHLGYFSYPTAVAACVVGGFLADLAWYTLGRLRGPRFRAGRLYRRVGHRIEILARRLGAAELIASRFVDGTKAASMVFWGLNGMSLPRFLVVDAIGCVLGSLEFTGLGYALSGSATVLLGRVRRVERWLLGAVLVGALLVFVIHWTAKKELHVDEEESA